MRHNNAFAFIVAVSGTIYLSQNNTTFIQWIIYLCVCGAIGWLFDQASHRL